MADPLLRVSELVVELPGPNYPVRPVDGASFEVWPQETVGIVGESGAGKSMTAMSVIGLTPPPGRVVSGEIVFDGTDLINLPRRHLRRLRGNSMSVVFQDPMSSLNPVLTIGYQLFEAIRVHDRSVSRKSIKSRVLELLNVVGLPHPVRRYDQYPLELSGGMRQRVMIAMAISNQPRLILADEPTTALDVTIQAQVLDALRQGQAATGAALVIITHDLGVIAETADRVVVMYNGRVVETGPVAEIFDSPRHPYTVGLLQSLPDIHRPGKRLGAIPGHPPQLGEIRTGCSFQPRCEIGRNQLLCIAESPSLEEKVPGHLAACHFSPGLVPIQSSPRPDSGEGWT